MTGLGWFHRKHGDSYHNQVTFSAESVLERGGAIILDHRIFKDRQCACDPDIYFKWTEIVRIGNTKKHLTKFGVVEVESNATKESIALKTEQYERTIVGVNLFILDLKDIDGNDWKDWMFLRDWCEKRLPV